jgi:hypothetical protein
VLRKVLAAKDYLRDDRKPGDKSPLPEPAMRAFGDYNARLLIDTRGLDVTGYRLAVFYP